MAEDLAAMPNGGCFLCGRPGAKRVAGFAPEQSPSGERIFRYDCPVCGEYEIHNVSGGGIPQPAFQPHPDGVESVKDAGPVEMEFAALEHWNKALDLAERQRRLPRRTNEPQAHHDDSGASACA
jgi:hypothetical protein